MSYSMQKCQLKVTDVLMNVNWIKQMYFCINKFEVGINVSIFSVSEQQKVLLVAVVHCKAQSKWKWENAQHKN